MNFSIERKSVGNLITNWKWDQGKGDIIALAKAPRGVWEFMDEPSLKPPRSEQHERSEAAKWQSAAAISPPP
jgi:hypothetical protein